jgi:hypothetical protein
MNVCVTVITVAMVMLLRDFGPYGITFMNVCVTVITVAMVMPLRDFGTYGIIFMNVCVIVITVAMVRLKGFWVSWDNIYDCVFTTLDFPVILDGQFIS